MSGRPSRRDGRVPLGVVGVRCGRRGKGTGCGGGGERWMKVVGGVLIEEVHGCGWCLWCWWKLLLLICP